MQMDACFEKEQIGTFFVGRGAVFGGEGGWVVPWGPPAENLHVTSTTFFYPPVGTVNFHWCKCLHATADKRVS
jgi:hypothetical protein